MAMEAAVAEGLAMEAAVAEADEEEREACRLPFPLARQKRWHSSSSQSIEEFDFVPSLKLCSLSLELTMLSLPLGVPMLPLR